MISKGPVRVSREQGARLILSPTLRRAWPRDGPEAAICVQGVDVQCVLQFTLIHAVGCALHRRTSRVIHRSKLFSTTFFLVSEEDKKFRKSKTCEMKKEKQPEDVWRAAAVVRWLLFEPRGRLTAELSPRASYNPYRASTESQHGDARYP